MTTEPLRSEHPTKHRDTGPVTVLGLGLMGRALAGALLRDGHPTTVWNRTAAKADDLVSRGATLAGSVGDAVAASPLVVVCVEDYDAVRALLDPLGDGALDGRVLVNLTSGTSPAARDAAALVQARGGAYLDGAILAAPAGIGTADAAILLSGPRAAFDPYASTLRGLAPDTRHLGDAHDLAALHEMALLPVMWSLLNGFLQGAAMLGAAGVDATGFATLAQTGIATVADWLPGYARQIDEGAYPVLDSTLDTHRTAMEHLVQESESLGISAELPRFVKALTDRAVERGLGGGNYAAMIELFRKPTEGRP